MRRTTKGDLEAHLMAETHLSRAQVQIALNAIDDFVVSVVHKKNPDPAESVRLTRLLTLRVSDHKERMCINPRNKEVVVVVPARRALRVVNGEALKRILNTSL